MNKITSNTRNFIISSVAFLARLYGKYHIFMVRIMILFLLLLGLGLMYLQDNGLILSDHFNVGSYFLELTQSVGIIGGLLILLGIGLFMPPRISLYIDGVIAVSLLLSALLFHFNSIKDNGLNKPVSAQAEYLVTLPVRTDSGHPILDKTTLGVREAIDLINRLENISNEVAHDVFTKKTDVFKDAKYFTQTIDHTEYVGKKYTPDTTPVNRKNLPKNRVIDKNDYHDK